MSAIKGYLYLAAFLALLGAIGAIYAKGRIDARHAVELQTLKTQIKVLEEERAREEAARKADAAQAKTDREEADLRELQSQELEDALTDRDRQCFDAGDADGLRDLLGNQN
jgi:hypothetical protein